MHDSVKKGEQGNTTEFREMIGKILIGQTRKTARRFHIHGSVIRPDARAPVSCSLANKYR